MAWVLHEDGLILSGESHYDSAKILELIKQLRTAPNNPRTVCNQLEELLRTGIASKQLIWRLSKWCDWPDKSEKIAQEIARELFQGHVCRRLWDQNNNPTPDAATAEADYEMWRHRVVSGIPAENQPPQSVCQPTTSVGGLALYERFKASRAKNKPSEQIDQAVNTLTAAELRQQPSEKRDARLVEAAALAEKDYRGDVSPTDAKYLAALYLEDETAWLEEMAELIHQGRLTELDYDNLGEYLTDMARSDRREVKSRLSVLLAHLLKWEYQPDRRSGSWRATIVTQRQELADLASSGVLRNHAEAILPEAYANAVEQAASETGLPEQTFPADCPYTVDQLLVIQPPEE